MEGFFKIFGIALFLMIVIAFTTTIFYPTDVTAEQQYEDYVQQNYLNEGAVLNFEQWINAQFDMCRLMLVEGYSRLDVEGKYNNVVPLEDRVYARLRLDYNNGIKNEGGWGYWKPAGEVFNIYSTGFAWWSKCPSLLEKHWLGLWGSDMKQDIKQVSYINYIRTYGFDLDENGDLYEYQKNLLDYAMDFIGSLGSAFVAMTEVLTFSFSPSGAPSLLGNIVSIFIYPLIAIVTIGIGIIVSKFISAIGNLIPFT